VTNRAHVHVRLGPLEFAFCHFRFSVSKSTSSAGFKVSAAHWFRAPLASREADDEDRLRLTD
jgi:hypothetical protein